MSKAMTPTATDWEKENESERECPAWTPSPACLRSQDGFRQRHPPTTPIEDTVGGTLSKAQGGYGEVALSSFRGGGVHSHSLAFMR